MQSQSWPQKSGTTPYPVVGCHWADSQSIYTDRVELHHIPRPCALTHLPRYAGPIPTGSGYNVYSVTSRSHDDDLVHVTVACCIFCTPHTHISPYLLISLVLMSNSRPHVISTHFSNHPLSVQVDELSRGPIRHILQAAKRLASNKCSSCGATKRCSCAYNSAYGSTARSVQSTSDDEKLFSRLKFVEGLSPSMQIMLQEMGVVFEKAV